MQNARKMVEATPNEQLRRERQRRGWSRAYIAEQIGVADPKTIGRWERGGAFPSAYFLQRLCSLFQMQAEELGLWPRESHEAEPADVSPYFSQPDQSLKSSAKPLYDPELPLALSGGLIGREKSLRALKARLCSQASPAATTLCGLPGVGKTALALELAHDDDVQQYFNDGVLWVSLGPQPDRSGELKRWGRLLGIEESALSSRDDSEDWMRAIHTRLSTRKMLLIIDDAWSCEDALAFKLGGQQCAYLLTTRQPAVALYFANAGICTIEALGEEESLALLARFVPTIVAQEPAAMRELARLAGGLPLALQLMGKHLQAQMYSGQPRRWHAALERLKLTETRLQLTIPRAPLERQMGLPVDAPLSLQNAINLSYQRLDSLAQQALLTLTTSGNFLEESALEQGISLDTLDSLLDAGLLASTGPGRYTLHQTIVDFAISVSSSGSRFRLSQTACSLERDTGESRAGQVVFR
jgi:transcriptional regulator with XRE-family HTH domain